MTYEKGSSEWNTFRAVREDRPRVGMFRVATPERPEREEVKRGTVVPVKRYTKPHRLFQDPRTAH